MPAESALHKLASPLLYKSGYYDRRWRNRASHEPFSIVLTYHRVVPDGDKYSHGFDIERGTPASVFEAQMRFMLKHFRPVRASRVKETGADCGRFAVTLDDGYEDNYHIAAPILERLGIPATFFVVSDFAGTDRLFWWEQIAYMLRNTEKITLQLQPDLDSLMQYGLPPSLTLKSASDRDISYTKLCAALRSGPHRMLPEYMDQLSETLGVQVPEHGRSYNLMDWTQLKDLLKRGFEIGGHTATHINVVGADKNMLEREIVLSNRTLEDRLDTAVETFAYPYGNYDGADDMIRQTLKTAGYKTAFTTVKTAVSGKSDPYEIPRTHLNRRYDFACAYNIHNTLMNNTGLE